VEKGLKDNTQKNYSRYLSKFINWLKLKNLENIKPHELSTDYIWEYRLYLSRYINPINKKPLSKATQNYYLIALRAFLGFFVAKDIISIPPEKITLPKANKASKTIKFLNLNQVKRLLESPDVKTTTGLRDRAILETFFSTGLRIAELVSLNVEQFSNIENKKDLELGIIGKGGTPRTVYFSERALSWIKKYLNTRKDKEKPLFINYRSRKDSDSRLTPRSIERIVKKYAIKAGIPIFTTPHTLRHSYATDLLNKGVDLRAIQEFLGHKNIATTQIYTHVTNKRLYDIHRKFHSLK
jgi:site-specific recombinase XerD